jgi:hypothetical protein
MSETKSPDGTYPTWPMTLPTDGELVNNDVLFTSASADRGAIGKLVDAVGFLKARSAQAFVISTDGAGNVTLERRTPKDDGSTAFLSAASVTATYIQLTYTTALADALDAAVHVSLLGTGDSLVQITAISTTYIRIGVRDISAAALMDPSAGVFNLYLTVYPNLAGYT